LADVALDGFLPTFQGSNAEQVILQLELVLFLDGGEVVDVA
jgi:hypothetical protein